MMSLNYYDNRGIIENSGMKRYSAKINVDQVINKYFKTGVNITASRIANDNTQLGAEEYEKSGMIRAAVQMNPNIPAITGSRLTNASICPARIAATAAADAPTPIKETSLGSMPALRKMKMAIILSIRSYRPSRIRPHCC